MLSIFTVPRPFVGHFDVIQRNALGSWKRLLPECQVILVGDETGVSEAAKDFGCEQVREIDRNEFGTPLLNDVFRKAEAAARFAVLSYVNTDIILLSDFLLPLQMIPWKRFLIIGRRWDYDLATRLDFANPNWEENLRGAVAQSGQLHSHTGVDYYTYARGLWGDMPPFAIGRTAYDNWWIYRARQMRVPIVDATKLVTAIHQNHGRQYSDMNKSPVDGNDDLTTGEEARRNIELAGHLAGSFTLRDATRAATTSGVRPAWTPWHLTRRPMAWLEMHPRIHRVCLAIGRPIVRRIRKVISTCMKLQ